MWVLLLRKGLQWVVVNILVVTKLLELNYTVIFLDFHSSKQGQTLADSWLHGLEKNQMYPDRDILSNVPGSGNITARDQGMVESGMTEGGKNTASFPRVLENKTNCFPPELTLSVY